MPYILEAYQYKMNEPMQHVGYVNKVFKTKQEASNYYDKFNPHMRSLNAHNTWCSDYDPVTGIMYVVTEGFHEAKL